MKYWILVIFFAQTALLSTQSRAGELSDRLSSLVKNTLEEKYSSKSNPAEIKIPSLEKLIQSSAFKNITVIKTIRLVEDKPSGVAIFEVFGLNSNQEEISKTIQTPFEAWVRVAVATHRIYPNTKLKQEDFTVKSLNVSSGMAREYRGILADAEMSFDKTESKQTILEGQFVVTSAIQKQPDLRRGDSVKLELVSGELTLTTQGIAQEPGSTGERIHVITSKTKREIVGVVQADHSVEVSL